jgi:hypothetical protein
MLAPIFSTGIVYEMSSQRSFREKLAPRHIQQILSEAPRPLQEWNRRISPQVESIMKALDKRLTSATSPRAGARHLERLVAQQQPLLQSRSWGASRRGWKAREASRAIYSSVFSWLSLATLWWLIGARPVLSFARAIGF